MKVYIPLTVGIDVCQMVLQVRRLVGQVEEKEMMDEVSMAACLSTFSHSHPFRQKKKKKS